MNLEAKLKKLCKQHNLILIERPNGHFQIQKSSEGSLLVNYYPYSKNRTAYIGRTKNGFKHVEPEAAVKMALEPPPVLDKTPKRKKNYFNEKDKLYQKSQCCHWCKIPLTRKQVTLDHVVPLSRGGLDHQNNYVIACLDCNNRRGNEMPELINGCIS